MRSKTASGCSKDFNGHITTFSHDVMNRLLSKTPDPVLAEPTVSFTYFPTGQRQIMSDATGVTTYGYDNRDRLLEKATPQGTLTYTWDAAGNVTSIVSSNVGGTNVQYTWDENNRLKDVIDVHAGTFTYSYDDVGNETGLSYPNGIQKTTTYDPQNRLRTIGYVNSVSTVASYAYALDVTGRRTGVIEHSGRTVQYGYDALYRLTSEEVTADPSSINGRVDYTYDPVGNRLRRDSTLDPVDDQVFSYNANDQIDGVEQYDLNGSLIQDQDGNTYAWDFEGRLVSMSEGQLKLGYNGEGSRTEKTGATGTIQYLADDMNPTGLVQSMEAVASAVSTVSWGRRLLRLEADGGLAILDGHGDVRATGAEVAAFDAFGVPLGPNSLHRGYLAEDSDGTTLLLRARHLATSTGRFLSTDPLTCPPRGRAHHSYAYAAGDPGNRFDPLGTTDTLIDLAIATAVVGVLGTLIVLAIRPPGERPTVFTTPAAGGFSVSVEEERKKHPEMGICDVLAMVCGACCGGRYGGDTAVHVARFTACGAGCAVAYAECELQVGMGGRPEVTGWECWPSAMR